MLIREADAVKLTGEGDRDCLLDEKPGDDDLRDNSQGVVVGFDDLGDLRNSNIA